MANTNKTTGKSPKATMENSANESMLHKLFSGEIKDIYYAEKQIIKTLPKLMKAATSPELKLAFQEHLDVTKTQVARLENVFELLDKKPQAKKSDAIEVITKQGDSFIEQTKNGSATRDIGLILAAQKIEHYEIATYGWLVQLATTLGLEEVSELLAATLEEEKEADTMFSGIAENDVNYSAVEVGESSDK